MLFYDTLIFHPLYTPWRRCHVLRWRAHHGWPSHRKKKTVRLFTTGQKEFFVRDAKKDRECMLISSHSFFTDAWVWLWKAQYATPSWSGNGTLPAAARCLPTPTLWGSSPATPASPFGWIYTYEPWCWGRPRGYTHGYTCRSWILKFEEYSWKKQTCSKPKAKRPAPF